LLLAKRHALAVARGASSHGAAVAAGQMLGTSDAVDNALDAFVQKDDDASVDKVGNDNSKHSSSSSPSSPSSSSSSSLLLRRAAAELSALKAAKCSELNIDDEDAAAGR
jgi:hypothetical protein